MINAFQRERIGNGVYFSSIQKPQFKTNLLVVNLLFPIDPEHLSENALVPMMLEKCCQRYNSYKTLSKQLDRMYGASAGAYLGKLGDLLSVSLFISLIGDRYALEGEELLKDGAELLLQLLFSPSVKDGLLDRENFLLQKQALIDAIQAEMNEKRRYALNRTLDIMFEGDPYGLRRYGTLKQAKQADLEGVTKAYERLLDTSLVEIIHVGQGDPQSAKELFRRSFGEVCRHPRPLPFTKASLPREQVREESERLAISQAKLCLGFKTGEDAQSPLLNSIRVMVSLLGGSPTSKLFENVREEMQLCYYCSAQLERSKGALLIDSGVDIQNMEKAKEAILDQIRQIREGDFTDEELEFAKLSLENSFRSAEESDFALQRYYLSALALGTALSPPSEQCGQIAAVTREEVIRAAGLLRLDTVYRLIPKEEG